MDTAERLKKARDILNGTMVVLSVNAAEKDRYIVYFEPTAKIEHEENGFHIDGHGWLVQWGKCLAEYGRIQARYSTPPSAGIK